MARREPLARPELQDQQDQAARLAQLVLRARRELKVRSDQRACKD